MAVFYIQNSILCPLTLYPLKKIRPKRTKPFGRYQGDIGGYGGESAV